MAAPAFIAAAAQSLEATYGHYGTTDCTWTPAGGVAVTGVTVIKTAPTVDIRAGEGRVRADAVQLRVRRKDVALVIEGDRATVDGATFAILAEPEADDFGLEWICEAAPVRSTY